MRVFPSYRCWTHFLLLLADDPQHVVGSLATGKRESDRQASLECVFDRFDQDFRRPVRVVFGTRMGPRNGWRCMWVLAYPGN